MSPSISKADVAMLRVRASRGAPARDTGEAKKRARAPYDPVGRRAAHLKTWGLTPERYTALLAHQRGVCALCGNPPPKSGRALHVDHDHLTMEIRGLLCHRCNRGLGYFKPAALERASAYMRTGTGLFMPRPKRRRSLGRSPAKAAPESLVNRESGGSRPA